MFSVPRVQDGGPLAGRMDGDVDGEVAEEEVLARRPQRPLIGQLHLAVEPDAWQDARRRRGARLFRRRLGDGEAAANAQEGGGCGQEAEHRSCPSG